MELAASGSNGSKYLEWFLINEEAEAFFLQG